VAEELKIREQITFLGLLPYSSLPACYHQADILLHTSLSEGHPIVVEEAMSSGVLVCGTRVGLLFDLPECCVSVPVRDYDALASETLGLISNPLRMKALKKAAHEWSKAHSLNYTARQVSELYNNHSK